MSIFGMHKDQSAVEMMEDALKEMRETLRYAEENATWYQNKHDEKVGEICLLMRRICEMESAVEKLKAAK